MNYTDITNWNEQRYDARRMVANAIKYLDPTFPRRFSFDMTDYCNRRCHYCPVSVYGAKKVDMPDAVFQAGLARMVEIKWTGQVTYNGNGEPLSIKDLERYVESVVRAAPESKSCIYTNGDYLTTDRAKSLYAAGVAHIIVTRHKPYKQAWQDRVMDVYTSVGGERMTLRSLPDSVLINPAGLVDVPYKAFKRCRLPSNNFAITTNGDVRMCCADFLKEWTPGNILRNSVMEIWNGAEFRRIRRRLMFGYGQHTPTCVKCMAGMEPKTNETGEH